MTLKTRLERLEALKRQAARPMTLIEQAGRIASILAADAPGAYRLRELLAAAQQRKAATNE